LLLFGSEVILLQEQTSVFANTENFRKIKIREISNPILFQAEKADLDNAEKLIGASKACPKMCTIFLDFYFIFHLTNCEDACGFAQFF
jgi:hypothetical protein